MARTYGNILTAIWRDPDWRALDGEAQRVYLLLATQPNISAAGMLPLTVGRWATMSSDTNAGDIRGAVARLAVAHFVIVDEETEEALVRSFVRHDNGYKNSKRRPVIRDAAGEIGSRRLRQALAVELVRLDLPADWTGEEPVEPDDPDSPPDGPSDGASRHQTPAEHAERPSRDTVDTSQVDTVSDGVSDAISGSERVVVTKGPYLAAPSLNPHSATPNPQPHPPALATLDTDVVEGEVVERTPVALFVVPDLAAEIAVPDDVNAGQITRQWIDYSAGNGVKLTTTAIKRYGRHVKAALEQGFAPDLIKHALAEMLRDNVASRPALFDNYLIRVQQGPEKPPRRMSQGEASAARHAPDGASIGALIHDALTRPA